MTRPRPTLIDRQHEEEVDLSALVTTTYDEEQSSFTPTPKPKQTKETPVQYLAPESHLQDHPVTYKTSKDYASLDEYYTAEGITSRPTRNWNRADPLAWCHSFGSRSPAYATFLHQTIRLQLQPGDEGCVDVSDMAVPGITMVRTKEQARTVLARLQDADPLRYHACDTEVMDIDLSKCRTGGEWVYDVCYDLFRSGF